MITKIFYDLASRHKQIKAFVYGKTASIGNGCEPYPLFWLEDPYKISMQSESIMRIDVNFSVTEIPSLDEEVPALQKKSFLIGLSIIEKLKRMNKEANMAAIKAKEIVRMLTFSAMPLREYYDNNACGFRFSIALEIVNPQNLCSLDDMFDDEEGIMNAALIGGIISETKETFTVYSDTCYLPKFDL